MEHHLFVFVDFFRSVGRQIGFKVLVFGPAGPDIEPIRCSFLYFTPGLKTLKEKNNRLEKKLLR